jgi:hypothetical protein
LAAALDKLGVTTLGEIKENRRSDLETQYDLVQKAMDSLELQLGEDIVMMVEAAVEQEEISGVDAEVERAMAEWEATVMTGGAGRVKFSEVMIVRGRDSCSYEQPFEEKVKEITRESFFCPCHWECTEMEETGVDQSRASDSDSDNDDTIESIAWQQRRLEAAETAVATRVQAALLGDYSTWAPNIMQLEQTCSRRISKKCSLASTKPMQAQFKRGRSDLM